MFVTQSCKTRCRKFGLYFGSIIFAIMYVVSLSVLIYSLVTRDVGLDWMSIYDDWIIVDIVLIGLSPFVVFSNYNEHMRRKRI